MNDNTEVFKIQTITAFVATGHDGDEGVMGVRLGETMYPLLCADEERISFLFPIAEDVANATGVSYRIIQFSNRVDVTAEITTKYKKP